MLTQNILNVLNYKHVHTISLIEFEKNDITLEKAKNNQSLIEYYWTLTANSSFTLHQILFIAN